jgi:hypothetical protein
MIGGPCRKQTNDREGNYEECFIKDLSERTHTFHNKKYLKISMRQSIMVVRTVLHDVVHVKAMYKHAEKQRRLHEKTVLFVHRLRK